MAVILFDGAEPFGQIVNTLSTDGPMRNLMKVAQVVSEKKTFENYTILYMQEQGQIIPGDKILIILKKNPTLIIRSSLIYYEKMTLQYFSNTNV